jgi:hypothetical protein
MASTVSQISKVLLYIFALQLWRGKSNYLENQEKHKYIHLQGSSGLSQCSANVTNNILNGDFSQPNM